jgi:hypothetical protein
MVEDFKRQQIDSKVELDKLNFIEATHLSIILLEYVMGIYDKLKQNLTSDPARQILESILKLKNEYLKNLRDEYEKLRYK